MEGRRDGTCGWKGANIVRLGYFCVVHHDFCLISIPIHCIYFCQEITPQHPSTSFITRFALRCWPSVFLGGLVPRTFACSLIKREHFKTGYSRKKHPRWRKEDSPEVSSLSLPTLAKSAASWKTWEEESAGMLGDNYLRPTVPKSKGRAIR